MPPSKLYPETLVIIIIMDQSGETLLGWAEKSADIHPNRGFQYRRVHLEAGGNLVTSTSFHHVHLPNLGISAKPGLLRPTGRAPRPFLGPRPATNPDAGASSAKASSRLVGCSRHSTWQCQNGAWTRTETGGGGGG